MIETLNVETLFESTYLGYKKTLIVDIIGIVLGVKKTFTNVRRPIFKGLENTQNLQISV